MKIYIIGAGAIGKALAVFLHQAGRAVELLRVTTEVEENEAETVEVSMDSGEVITATIRVSTLENTNALHGIAVLTTKAFGNAGLAKRLGEKLGSSPLVILQNGLGIEKPFQNESFPFVYRCVLMVTSQLTASGLINYRPVATCPVGVVKGTSHELNKIIKELDVPHFNFKAEPDIQPMIWKKVIINCVFNSVCPLLETDNGLFYRDEAAMEIAETLIKECLTVAETYGVRLSLDEITRSLQQISRFADGQLISTLQDIRNGRQTEIGVLNLEIARLAKMHGLHVPQTELLGKLIQLKSGYP